MKIGVCKLYTSTFAQRKFSTKAESAFIDLTLGFNEKKRSEVNNIDQTTKVKILEKFLTSSPWHLFNACA